MHKPIFWTAKEQYLISKAIPINEFKENPNNSIPLKNCFKLAGIDWYQKDIGATSTQIHSSDTLQILEELDKKTRLKSVTKHINKIWTEHKIKITFYIDNNDYKINFHIEDSEPDSKAQTVDQRSDGFRQFISFLLTISAENKNGELSNSMLLIDEPETHLHPQAQKYFLQELIKITDNDRNNNIVIFATHSTHMIDKENLNNYFRIQKKIRWNKTRINI